MAPSVQGTQGEFCNFDEILNLHKAGEISPLIGAEFQLEEFSDALNCLAKRTATGKIIVNIN